MGTYAHVDDEGTIVNKIVWDGVTPFEFGDGALVLINEPFDTGGTFIKGVYTPPEPVVEELSSFDKLVNLLVEKDVITKEDTGVIGAVGTIGVSDGELRAGPA